MSDNTWADKLRESLGYPPATVPPASPREPELHVGSEHQGLSGVWVVCTCGLSTKRQAGLLKASKAWDEHAEHALAALREAVSVAHATRQVAAPRPTSVTDLCDALADEFGCSPTEADRLAAGLAREADNAARVLLEPGTPCPPVRVCDRVSAVLLTAAAKRLA